MSTFALMMALLAALASLGVAVTAWLATLSVGDEVSFAGFKLMLTDDSAAGTERHGAQTGRIPSPQLFAGQP